MNQIDLSKKGGHKFRKNDLFMMQESYVGAIKAISKLFDVPISAGLPTNSFVMYGCGILDDASSITIAEGYICIEGEPVYCPPQQVFKLNPALIAAVTIEVTYPAVVDPTPYADGNSYNIHAIRRCKLSAIAGPNYAAGQYSPYITLGKYLAQKMDGAVADTAMASYQSAATPAVGQFVPKFSKDAFGNAYLHGAISISANGEIAQAPVGFFPAKEHRYIASHAPAYDKLVTVVIRTDGKIFIEGNLNFSGGSETIHLDNMYRLV